MKRLLALTMLLCLALFVVACGPKADKQPAGDGANAETTETGDAAATEGDAASADIEEDAPLENLEDLGAAAPKSPIQPAEVDINAADPLKAPE